MAAKFYFNFFLCLLAIFSSANCSHPPSQNHDLIVAIGEMQKANYFTFVMLINMLPIHNTLANLTFLMPNDRTLSKIVLPHDDVPDFLHRHSIPSPLLFEYLERFPSGSIIPSSLPDYMLRISNGGRKSFLLNNVRIISRNICTAGSSIRCHGIDGVLTEASAMVNSTVSPLPPCSSSSSPPPFSVASPPSPSSRPLAPPVTISFSPAPAASPAPIGSFIGSKNSGSTQSVSFGVSSKFVLICLMMVSIIALVM